MTALPYPRLTMPENSSIKIKLYAYKSSIEMHKCIKIVIKKIYVLLI